MRSLLDRVLDYIVKGPGGCWLWLGGTGDGYALMKVDGRTAKVTHVAWRLLVGPVPRGLEPDHLCRVRRCINPDHIEWVTKKENILRGEGACAKNARKVVCLQGHPLSGENVVREPGGGRRCRTCQREGRKRRRQERRVANAI